MSHQYSHTRAPGNVSAEDKLLVMYMLEALHGAQFAGVKQAWQAHLKFHYSALLAE